MDRVVVEIREPGREPRRVSVTATVEVGRECNGVLVADDSVSRRHIALTPNPMGLTVTDLGSSNGTLVNGSPIAAPVVIGPNDVVQVGATTLAVVERTAPPPPSPKAPPPQLTVHLEPPGSVPPAAIPSRTGTVPAAVPGATPAEPATAVPVTSPDGPTAAPAVASDPPPIADASGGPVATSPADAPSPASAASESPRRDSPVAEPTTPSPSQAATVPSAPPGGAVLRGRTLERLRAAHAWVRFEVPDVDETRLHEVAVDLGLDHLQEILARLRDA